MKKNKVLKIITLIIMLAMIIVTSNNVVYANQDFGETYFGEEENKQEQERKEQERVEQENKKNRQNSQGLPDLDSVTQPSVELSNGNIAFTVVTTILGALRVVGVIALVISISLLGFGAIMGSANDKAIAKEKYMGILVASIMIVAGSAFAEMIIKAAESI